MCAELIKNILAEEDYAKLLLKRNSFTFTDANGNQKLNGPTMLWFVLDRVDPDVIVGVEVYRKELETLRMHKFNNDVMETCDRIEFLHKSITDLGGKCESMTRYTYEALSSGPNDTFNGFINQIYDDIESKTGYHKNAD